MCSEESAGEEMRMLRWMCGVTKMDKIRNDIIHGHVMRREEEYVGNRSSDEDVEGKRRKARPKLRWMDGQCNFELKGEGAVEGEHRNTGLRGGNLSETSTATQKWGHIMRWKKNKIVCRSYCRADTRGNK